MKKPIRYFTSGLFSLFEAKGYGKGKHHWRYKRWRTEAQSFAKKVLGKGLNEKDLNALIMLLYPKFGVVAQ